MINTINRFHFGTGIVPRPQAVPRVAQQQLEDTITNFTHLAGKPQFKPDALIVDSTVATPEGLPQYKIQVTKAQQGQTAQVQIDKWCPGEEIWTPQYTTATTRNPKAPEVYDVRHDVTLEGKQAKALLGPVQPLIDQAVRLLK